MKKTLSLLLILAAILSLTLSFSSCDISDLLSDAASENPEDDIPANKFHCQSDGDQMILTATENFSSPYLDRGSYTELFFGKYYAMVDPMAFSTITPNEGYSFPTLQEFFGYIVLDEGDEFETDGNLVYFNQSDADTTRYSFFFESENSFWWVQFAIDLEHATAEDALAAFKEMANNIVIINASERTE